MRWARKAAADVAVNAAADRVLAAIAQGDTASITDDLRVLEDKVSARLEVTANVGRGRRQCLLRVDRQRRQPGSGRRRVQRDRSRRRGRHALSAIACRKSVPR